MTLPKVELSEQKETQKEIFESFDYTIIGEVFDKSVALINIYKNNWFFDKWVVNKWIFEDYIDTIFQENNLNYDSLIWTKFQNNKFYFYFDDWNDIEVEANDLKESLLSKALEWEKKEDIEARATNLNNAIEAIYQNNQSIIFDWEIDDNDIVTDRLIKKYKLDPSYKNLNLKELKSLLDIENSKLFRVYDITWESHKKQSLLKKEIDFYTWVWDKYEWAAFYIWMKTEEISLKVQELCDTMSLSWIFSYIQTINERIDWNLRRSDMVDQVNLKLTNALYDYTFDKLKKENSTNEDFIKFIKLITGRWKLEIDKDELYEEKQDFEYSDIDIDEMFKAQNVANQALIHIMYREWWLLEEIQDKKEVTLEDEAMQWKTPSWLLNEAKELFNSSVNNEIEGYWKKTLNSLDFTADLDKPYEDLSFEEKVKIWSLARMLQKLKTLNPEQIKDESVLEELSAELVKESFESLNESFSDNFDETLFDWDWTGAEDLGLKWTSAEIFELYQDINWNEWLFDWKDSNELWLWSISIWIALIAAVIILWPVLVWWAAGFTFTSWLIAWAKVGLIAGVSSQVFSRKWYDTYWEWIKDVSSQIAVETIISALLTAGWFYILRARILRILDKRWLSRLKDSIINWERDRLWKTWLFNADLFFSKKAWMWSWLIDKWVMATETWLFMVVSNYVNNYIKKQNIEHHKDTDEKQSWQIQ